MRGYLTPDTLPAGLTCRVLFIPDDRDWVAQVYGALENLTFPSSWTLYGSITPDETAAEYKKMWYKLLDNQRGCHMTGEIILWAGSSAPDDDNLLLCDGTHYSNADYPDLWAVIGTTYGGAGATDFALPDMRGAVAIGESSGHALASTGGADTVTLTTAEMPAHAHLDAGHTHTDVPAFPAVAQIVVVPQPVAIPGVGVTGIGFANIQNTGGGGAHENMQPFLTLRYYIQAR